MTQLIFKNLVLSNLYKVSVKEWGVMLCLLEGRVSTYIIWNSSEWNICSSLFIQSFIYIIVDSWIILVHSGPLT